MAERDPANRITSIALGGGTALVVGGVPTRPSSVAMISAGQMLVCSDQVIERVDFTPFQATGPLLMGIGFVPFDKVLASGLATTDPGYFYPVTNVPFGGTLPLMVNFQRAANDGAKFYRVRIDGVLRTDTWTAYKWNGTSYVLQTIGPVNVGGNPDFYPVHPIAELFLWMNPSLLRPRPLSTPPPITTTPYQSSTPLRSWSTTGHLPLHATINNVPTRLASHYA